MLSSGGATFDPAQEGWSLDREGGFVELIGPIWMKRQEGGLAFALVVGETHLNRNGFLHGGMFAAFFDHAMGVYAYEAGGSVKQVTIQLNIQFVKDTQMGRFIEMHSEVMAQTASLMFMRGTCVSGGDRLATADGIWKKIIRG